MIFWAAVRLSWVAIALAAPILSLRQKAAAASSVIWPISGAPQEEKIPSSPQKPAALSALAVPGPLSARQYSASRSG